MKRKEILFDYMRGNGDHYFTLKDKLSMEQQLYKRRAELNNDFELTDIVLEKFEQLNNILIAKEKQILEACINIEADILNADKWRHPFTDYEISINMTFYSNKLIEANTNLEIDYLWESNVVLFFTKKEFESLGMEKTNWINFNRDFGQFSPEWNTFNFENVTRSFYELCNNSPLAYEDILKIDNIWWDIDVSYQFNKQFKL